MLSSLFKFIIFRAFLSFFVLDSHTECEDEDDNFENLMDDITSKKQKLQSGCDDVGKKMVIVLFNNIFVIFVLYLTRPGLENYEFPPDVQRKS